MSLVYRLQHPQTAARQRSRYPPGKLFFLRQHLLHLGTSGLITALAGAGRTGLFPDDNGHKQPSGYGQISRFPSDLNKAMRNVKWGEFVHLKKQ